MEHVPVSTVHAVLIADVIVNGVSINVGQFALALVRRHLVRAALLLLLRLVGEVEGGLGGRQGAGGTAATSPLIFV